MTVQRIKVQVSELRDKVAAAKEAAVATHEADMKAYEAAMAALRKEVIATLSAEVKRIKAGGDVVTVDRYSDVPSVELPRLTKDDLPRRVSQKPDVANFDRDIALLDMSTEEVISISVDSAWARYL